MNLDPTKYPAPVCRTAGYTGYTGYHWDTKYPVCPTCDTYLHGEQRDTTTRGVPMIRKMKIPRLIRVRGVDSAGIIRHTRIFQQRPAATKFARYLESHGYAVRIETARNVEFELVGRHV